MALVKPHPYPKVKRVDDDHHHTYLDAYHSTLNMASSKQPPVRSLVQGSLVLSSKSHSPALFNPNTKADAYPSEHSSSQSSPYRENIRNSRPEQRPTTACLDISDTQFDVPKEEVPQVIVVDALTQRLGPDVAEVSVEEHMGRSPAKVICHSSRAARAFLRNSGDTSHAASIRVDSVTSRTITPAVQRFCESSRDHSPDALHTSNLQNKAQRRTVAGGVLDPKSACDLIEQRSPPHLSRPIGSESPEDQQRVDNDASSACSENRAERCPEASGPSNNSSKENRSNTTVEELSVSADKASNNSGHLSDLEKGSTGCRPTKTKTNAPKQDRMQGRIVMSKFMQAAAAVKTKRPQSQQASFSIMLQKSKAAAQRHDSLRNNSTDKPRSSKMVDSVSSSNPRTGRVAGDKVARVPVSKMATQAASANTPKLAQTQCKRQASTPEHVSLLPHESFDISAVSSNKTMNRLLNDSESFLLAPSQLNANNNAGEKKSTVTHTKQCEDVTQNSINTLYARYLQWCFLSSKANKATDTEEKDVLAQLCGLWEENRKMKQKLSMLDQEYDRLCHVTSLDEIIDLQKSCLSPIVHDLPTLDQYYRSMAQALDTTRHELQASGVYLPDTQSELVQHEESMIAALKESELLLAEIGVYSRQKAPSANRYAQAVKILERACTEESHELARCEELVRVVQTLSNQENSMKIEAIEFSRL